MQQKLFLGIDASKGYADFVILDAAKQTVVPNFQLDDTIAGHHKLYQLLEHCLKHHRHCMLFAGIESTGGYENNWFNSLLGFSHSLNIKAARLNPCGVSAFSKAELTRMTTDPISARAVAQYLIAHGDKVSFSHQDLTAGMRRRWNLIKMLTKQNTQLINHLQMLMYTAHPQLMVYCKDEIPNWVFELLKRYPTCARLSRATTKALAQIPYITKQRATQLIADAKVSVGSAVDSDTEQVIKMTVQQIVHLKKAIAVQKDQLNQQCLTREVELLKSFAGISTYSAVGLMIEIQTITRFVSAKKLACFFGLHPVFKSSGDHVGRMRMSKKGRKQPRCILYMVARSAIVCNPLIRSIYQRHVQKGMAKMAAIGVCMHKICRIIYGMLKHQKPFDPAVDEQNRQKTKKASQASDTAAANKNRRYQPLDPKAPVSKRQAQKRRGNENLSQDDHVIVCGINQPVASMT